MPEKEKRCITLESDRTINTVFKKKNTIKNQQRSESWAEKTKLKSVD